MAEEAFKEGVAGIDRPEDLQAFLKARMWTPGQQKVLEQGKL